MWSVNDDVKLHVLYIVHNLKLALLSIVLLRCGCWLYCLAR